MGDRTAALGTGKRLIVYLQRKRPEVYRLLAGDGTPTSNTAKRGRPAKSEDEKRATKAANQRRFRGSLRRRENAPTRETDPYHVASIFPPTAAVDSKGLAGTENQVTDTKSGLA